MKLSMDAIREIANTKFANLFSPILGLPDGNYDYDINYIRERNYISVNILTPDVPIYSLIAANKITRNMGYSDRHKISITLTLPTEYISALLYEIHPNLAKAWTKLNTSKIEYLFNENDLANLDFDEEPEGIPKLGTNITSFEICFMDNDNAIHNSPNVVLRFIAIFCTPLYNQLLLNIDALAIIESDYELLDISIKKLLESLLAKDASLLELDNLGSPETKIKYERHDKYKDFNLVKNLPDISNFETDFTDGVDHVAYYNPGSVALTDDGGQNRYEFFLIIYDADVYTLDLIPIPSNVTMPEYVRGMPDKNKYITVVNGPFFKGSNNLIFGEKNAPNGKSKQVGFRKIRRDTFDGMPKILGPVVTGWNARSAIPIPSDLPALITINTAKEVFIREGLLKSDSSSDILNIKSRNVLCAFDGLTYTYSAAQGANSPLSPTSDRYDFFSSKTFGTGSNSMPFIGKIAKTINGVNKEFLFVLQSPIHLENSVIAIGERNYKKRLNVPVSELYKNQFRQLYQIMATIHAQDVVFTDGSTSLYLNHNNVSINYYEYELDALLEVQINDKMKDMPVAIGVIKKSEM